MATVNKNNLSDSIVTATLSVPNETTVIYGQQFYLDVTLSSELYFPQGLFLDVTAKSAGITIVPIGEAPVSSGSEKSIVGHYKVAIDVSDANTITDGLVLFTVKFSSSEIVGYDNDFKYSVKKIIRGSLQLKPNKLVCVIPEKYSDPKINDPQDNYFLYEAKLLEDTGGDASSTPLKKALIYLVSSPDTDINRDIIITSDSDENTGQLINYIPVKYNENDFISLISDEQSGKIRFRVYSNNKPIGSDTNYKPTILSLGCEILDHNPVQMSESVFFITPRPFLNIDDLEKLYIPSADGGVIHGAPGKSSFVGIIQNNINYKDNDRLLFFTKEKNNIPDVNSLIPPIYRMEGVIDNYSYNIPFEYFKNNVWTEIFYVITNRGYTHYSISEKIKYIGVDSVQYTLKFELIHGNEIVGGNMQSQKVQAILTGTGEGVNTANRKLNLSIDGSASFKEDSRVQTISVITGESGKISFELYDSNHAGETVTLTGELDIDKKTKATKRIHFPSIKVESISLQPENNIVAVGSTVWLTATVKETGGITQEGIEVAFSADNGVTLNPFSATTDEYGVALTQVTSNHVVATTVTATAMGKNAMAHIDFVQIESISLQPENITIVVGGSVQLTATVMVTGSIALSGIEVNFTTDAPYYLNMVYPMSAKTNYKGQAMTRCSSMEGLITATATALGKSATAQIYGAIVNSISLQPENSFVPVGTSASLTAKIIEEAEGVEIVFNADNKGITLVPLSNTTNAKGEATTQITSNQEGSTTVTASVPMHMMQWIDPSVHSTAHVTFAKPYIITIAPDNAELGEGGSVTFSIGVKGLNDNVSGNVEVSVSAFYVTFSQPSGSVWLGGAWFHTVATLSEPTAIIQHDMFETVTVTVKDSQGYVQHAYAKINLLQSGAYGGGVGLE
ncbi:inverse autotransporter beta-barrel domain-containing protein [Xenorhabdus stockiae]|uniref:Inverse autotransporter beta-barrel domain-containing protein n=1 Tax=Xenorhabdus stockiae TaxID=351614 RepID=A0A2D0KMD9_9GAMM|nr:Ig-like domain-containing protein [Xenorhabdus stockiae]PHM64609.1 inverse autotransporter beta-barrel domain-containing protein [Xenorhabdus stockiae]